MSNEKEKDQIEEKKGFFSRIFGGSTGKGCCNVRIVPKEEPSEVQEDEDSVGEKEKDNKEQ